MEFAFYDECGTLHDAQDLINEQSINPATNQNYTEEELNRLNIYDLNTLLNHHTYFIYMATDHTEDLIQAIRESI